MRVVRVLLMLVLTMGISFPVNSQELTAKVDKRALKEGKKWETKGLELYKEARYNEAIIAMNQSLIRQTGNRMAIYYKALCNWHLGHTAASLKEMTEVTRLFPDWEEPFNSLGFMQITQGDYRAARASLQQAVELKPDFGYAWYHLGVCHYQAGQLEAAKACYESALNYQPQFAEAHASLGMVYLDQRNLEVAKSQATEALNLDAKLDQAWYLLSIVNFRNNPAEARIYILKAIEINPQVAYLRFQDRIEKSLQLPLEGTITASRQP